jgi:hypothetical protein
MSMVRSETREKETPAYGSFTINGFLPRTRNANLI